MDIKKKQLLVSTGQSLEKISRLLGINLTSTIGKIYTLVFLVLICFLNQMTWHHLCTDHCEKQFVKQFMVAFQHILYMLLMLTIVGTSFFHPKQFTFPHREMSVIDAILESYGVRFSDKDIFLMKHLQDITTAIMISLTAIKCIYNIIMYNSFELIWLSVYSWYVIALLLIMDGLFVHYLNDIYIRFRELNKIAIQHSWEELSISCIDFTIKSNFSNKHSSTLITRIRSIQHIHHGLYILATKVNTNFGLQLLIASVICLDMTILYLHDIYHSLRENTSNKEIIIFHTSFIFCCALRFLYISYICQRTRNESRKMAKILHSIFFEYQSLRSEVVHFSLQMVHEDLIFTAFGLYEINMPLVCSIAGAVLTYLVMVVQLDIASKFDLTNTTFNYIENNTTV